MAPPAMLKRSSRLNSHDLSTKAASRKKLRSRQVTTANDSLQKITISAENKRLQAVENISTQKSMLNKVHKNNSHGESRKLKNIKNSNKEKQKTHSKKKSNVISNSTNKRYKKTMKRKTNNSTVLRQISLKESFTRQSSLKHLRPRQNKNYCEDSKLLKQYLPLQQQDSVVILEKLDIKKVPVYKTIKTSEVSLEDKNDIYDFKYDANDTNEKLTKKKKNKRNIKKAKSKVVKKTVHKKVTIQSKTTDQEVIKSSESDTNFLMDVAQNNSIVESPKTSLVKSTKEGMLENIVTPITDTKIQAVETILPDQTVAKHIRKQDTRKLKIISIENANNIIVTKLPPGNSEDFQPFRPTNLFDNKTTMQYKNRLSCSLLTKSLSPILKTYNSFDPGSPWRSPILPIYPAKHFLQSTPNVSKLDVIHKKHLIHVKNNSHDDKAANVSDITLKNMNSIQNTPDKSSHKKKSNVYRKFGTEITNVEHLNNSSVIQNNNVEIINEKVNETKSNVQLNIIASESSNHSSFDDIDDKENAAPNYQTPQKPKKKKIKKQYLSNVSPSKAYEIKSNVQKENLIISPQPGPSGVKNLSIYNEQKILCQSNLNNFLNIMDMPENTRISTKHGIFDGAHSTPISTSAIKKVKKVITNELENAFGFCEKESQLDISPIAVKTTSEFMVQSVPARLSAGELRNHLLQKKPNDNVDSKQTIENVEMLKQKNIEIDKPLATQKDEQLINVSNFSDTFDVLSESERLSNCEANVPLFMDLEPSHFIKPPQHSYKRKRTVMFNFSEDSSEEEEKEAVKTYTKKKKLTKLERENRKRLDEWVKSVNNTFQEIDEYDLVIE